MCCEQQEQQQQEYSPSYIVQIEIVYFHSELFAKINEREKKIEHCVDGEGEC